MAWKPGHVQPRHADSERCWPAPSVLPARLLDGSRPPVRVDDHLLQVHERIASGAFIGQYIEGRSSKFATLYCVMESCLIDHLAT